MCRRCAASARESDWRSRSAARTWPRFGGGAPSTLSVAESTGLLRLLRRFPRSLALELHQLRRVREAAPQLLQEALLGSRILVGARDPHPQDERVVRGRGETHVAHQEILRVLGRAALEGDHREVVEPADQLGPYLHCAAQVVFGFLVAP